MEIQVSKDRKSLALRVLILLAVAVVVAIGVSMLAPVPAFADIHAGDTTIHGYTPNEVISTDVDLANGDASNLGPMLSERVRGIVIMMLPLLAIASVVVLIYNAVRNMFLPDEDPHDARKLGHKPKRPIGKVLKDIFMMFFWILFAWIIVELIIYAVTRLETMATSSLTTGSSQQQVATQQGNATATGTQSSAATPVGSGTVAVQGDGQQVATATPVGGGTVG